MNARAILNMSEQDGVPLLTAILRRDWSVRVLDAWAAHDNALWSSCVEKRGGSWACYVGITRATEGHKTGDAARLAAAEAVWPELPEGVRAEIGERP